MENNRPVSNYRHYSLKLNRKRYGGRKITDVTGVTIVAVKNKNVLCCVLVWCGVRVRVR